MTTTLRPLYGIVLAALIALTLVSTTVDAIAASPVHGGGDVLFDRGHENRGLILPRPVGRLGISWE